MERNYPKILVTDKAARSLRSGHPWVYADEVLQADAACANGQIVDVTTRSGHWLGAGFYNSASKIRVRVLSRNANDRFDEAFWTRRIQYAVDYRRTVMGQDFDNCRLIFGESDGFPGLTVDRFGPILVAQVLSLGMELRKMQLFVLLLQRCARAANKSTRSTSATTSSSDRKRAWSRGPVSCRSTDCRRTWTDM